MRLRLFLLAALVTTPLLHAQPPNILFIAVDDLRPELGCYGTRALTPNIDKLAQSGLQFDRAYCNQAVCGASRVSLMTGLYPEHTGERSYHVTNWRTRWKDTVTLNQHFVANGYTAIGLGKVYHATAGAGVDPGNWTQWISVKGAGYANAESLKAIRTTKKKSPGGATKKKGPATEAADGAENEYADGKRAEVGAKQIAQLAKAGRPFFLAVGFTKPHLPFTAPTKFWNLYERESFSLPDNLGFPPGYPDYARNITGGELRAYSDIPLAGLPADFPDELNKRLLHGYHACVSYMDRNVGILLDALEKSGAAKNTIVVFWADHGWKLGDHSSWCKHTNFECDNRVPLIIRHPGKDTAKGHTKALVELIDLYPTLCDLSGLDKPRHLQGKSLAPILDNPKSSHRKSAYSSYPHSKAIGHSLRTVNFRYTEWWQKDSDKVVASAMTDLTRDPGETTSVEGSKELKAFLSSQLRQRVLSVRKPSPK